MHDDRELPALPSLRTILLVIGGFVALGVLVYGGSMWNAFVRWDDGMLIYENPAIRTIAPWSLKRIFTTYDPELYIPLTFLTYQINYAVGGINPFAYHLTNLLLHIGNALLAAWFILLLTRKRLVGVLVGLLFLLHPLHTEAVEWASARKDVLSTFFFLAALVGYLYWRSSDERKTLILSVVLFVLGLMSKVMVITLPVILVLIDWYEGRSFKERRLWIEKWPYLLMAVVFGIIGLFGKQGVVASTSLLTKLLMACKSAVFYLWQMVWPLHFSLLYPYTKAITITSPDFFVPVLVLVALAAVAIVSLRWTRAVMFGLLFYGITVAPTFLNFAKGGDLDIYFASDRYAYVPSIGIFLLVALGAYWLQQRMVERSPSLGAWGVPALSLAVLASLALKAHAQAGVWTDTKSLFGNVLKEFPETSYVAHNNLGNVYRLEGDLAKSEEEYKAALAIRKHPKTMANLGAVYRRRNQIDQAINTYKEALELDPNSPDAHFGLGIVYAQLGNFVAAQEQYQAAIEADPSKAGPYLNYGALLAENGQDEEAATQFRLALGIDPDNADALYNLGYALTSLNRPDEAIAAYAHAIEVQPSVAAYINLGLLLHQQGRMPEAIAQFRGALKLDPTNAAARSALQQLGAQ